MIAIRKAEEKDATAIVLVHKKSWLATYPEKSLGITVEKIEKVFSNFDERVVRWRKRIAEYDWIQNGIWVAVDNEMVVGFVAPAVMDEKRRVGAIYIDPEYIGKGIGGLLIEKVFILYKDKEVYCEIASHNAPAQKFYENHGFVLTGDESVVNFESKGEAIFQVPVKELLKQC